MKNFIGNTNNDWAVATFQTTTTKSELTPAQAAEKAQLLNDPKGGYFGNLKKLFS